MNSKALDKQSIWEVSLKAFCVVCSVEPEVSLLLGLLFSVATAHLYAVFADNSMRPS